jgi:GT2 family glycosyltransferase
VNDDSPLVSIVIPARNEARHLARVFAALAALDYPRDRREVILVDNGSDDDTAAIAKRHGARVIPAPGVNVGEVRNLGARAALGEVIAFLDADCLAGPLWLRTAVALLDQPQVGAVGGNCTVGSEGNWVQQAWVVEPRDATVDAGTLATASFILRRRLFEELGGFDPALGAGEDDDLSQRIRAAGYRLQRAAECSVVHLGYPDTLGGVMRRQLWHGRSQLHGVLSDPMLLLTHLFALLLFMLVPAGLLWDAPGAALAGAAGTAACAALPALRKERQGMGFSMRRLGQRVVIYWWFLLGRGCGLVLGYFDRLGRAWPAARAGEGRP